MIDGFCVLTTHKDLVKYLDSLQKKNAEALSFYPRAVFEREEANGRLFLGLLNGQPAGYIYVGSGRDRVVRCHQVCIEYDARRRLYGAALVTACEEYAKRLLATRVRLRCGFDLAANDFWASLGYQCVDVQQGGVRRMRKINVWEKLIGPELFLLESVAPSSGVVDASMWRRNKKTGVVNQFARGKKMHEYRRMITLADDAQEDA
jgi:GNAT superfamily N-acetyltransferase